VVRRLKDHAKALFTSEDVVIYREANGDADGAGGRLTISMFQALVRRAVVVRAKGVPDATKVRTVARVHFTRAVPITQVEYGEEKIIITDTSDAYGNFHGYTAGVVVKTAADGSLSLYLAPCAYTPGTLLRGVPADAVRFDELE
jgi:hypothetical protein